MSKSILSFLLMFSLLSAAHAEPAPTPESHLLLPYFEVSLDGLQQMTFFSIVNASDDEIDLTAKVYTNWAIPMLEVAIRLTGKEVLQINLHDWIAAGRLPGGESVCGGGADDCLELTHIQAALAGEPSTITQLYYGTELERRLATGFITVEADDGFLPESDVLWGDYFYTDPAENFAQGQRLVRLEPDLSCADLCYRHSIRFLEGGAFSGGTKLTIWNWDGTEREPSEFPDPGFELGEAQIDVYSQEGELIDVIPALPVLPAQTIRVEDLDIDQPFGWFDLTTLESSSVSGFYRAMGRFSVGVPSWCLPCDPCNRQGPCYEPGHPQCRAQACIAPRLRLTSSLTQALVGEPFSLSYRVSGSPHIEVEVHDLPDGLVHVSPDIFGIPRLATTFTLTAENDCGDDELSITIHPALSEPLPRLTLIKRVINDDGGTAVAEDFPLFVDGQRVTTGLATTLQEGIYRASEENLSGYVAGTWTGDCGPDGEVELEAGDNKVCEIVNDDQPAHLTLIKTVVNDDGGTARVADFDLFIDGRQVASRERVELPAGSYTASEHNLPGYIAGSWTGACSSNGAVTLAPGDDKVCRITNDDRPPGTAHLTLIKEVVNDDGGTARVADFDLFINGRQVASGERVELAPGSYRASEQNLPGYQAGSWGRACAADGSVTLAEGDDKVCRITNDDRPATLTLVKHVVNDDGGTARIADFDLFVNGQQVTSGAATGFAPGSYTASEQNRPGYQAGSWSGDCAANGSVSLALGEHKVCEITNDDRPATLTLVKHVVNDDGGTARVADFDLFVNGQRVTSGVATGFAPGHYTASEQNLPGYQAGSWSGDCAANGSVSLALGEHKVCEITNDDRPATLTLVKHVVNDDGGTAQVADFDLFVSGQQVTSGVATEFAPGSYTASEQNLPGYQAGSWGGDCAADGSVSLALGEHKVCEITNDDVCDPTPVFRVANGRVDYNDPHRHSHHTEVRFDFEVDGEVDGEVQLFWSNGGNTFVKKRISVSLDCADAAVRGSLFWDSDSRSHHPEHGAEYSARLVVNGQVVSTVDLN